MDKRFVIFLLVCLLLLWANMYIVSLFNDPPTDIQLSQAEIAAGSEVGAEVGKLKAKDPDDSRHLFTLTDSADGRFKIEQGANSLRVAKEGLTEGEQYKVKIEANDGRNVFEKELLITATEPADVPALAAEDDPPVAAPPVEGKPDQVATDPAAEDPNAVAKAGADDPAKKQEWVALGSASTDSPYRMLVILTNKGAALERVELNQPLYLDLEARRKRIGYLGHLALTPEEGGLRVGVVGPGTPAATAGVQPGDLIVGVSAGGRSIEKLDRVGELESFLQRQKVGQTATLKLRRSDEQNVIEVTPKLGWVPLQLIQPERSPSRPLINEPLSTLLTLDEIRRGDEEWRIPQSLGAKLGTGEDERTIITDITAGGPADVAGLRKGDVVVQIGETEIESPSQLTGLVRESPAGLPLLFQLERNGAPLTELLELPAEIEGLHLRSGNWSIVREETNEAQVVFSKTVQPWNIELRKTYRLAKIDEKVASAGYHLTLDVAIANRGETPLELAYQLDGPNGLPDEGWWYGMKIGRNWGTVGARDLVYQFQDQGAQMVNTTTIAEDEAPLLSSGDTENSQPLNYIGVDAKYFAATFQPQRPEGEAKSWFSQIRPLRVGVLSSNAKEHKLTNVSFRLVSRTHRLQPLNVEKSLADDSLSPLEAVRESYTVFLGPKEPKLLSRYDLDPLVYYGWFSWVAQGMVSILHFFYGMVGNYGLSIILLTVLVRACMFPLSRKQVLNAQKMQELQPQLKALNEKYKQQPEKRVKATQDLFKKNNYNPLGGCLMLFVQLPVFIGLYRGLSVDVTLRQQPLIPGLPWCSNLAAPDMLFDWSGFMPPFMASETGWLGPYFNLLPIITICLFLVQQKMFTPPPTDEQQAMQMKMMKYMMVFFAFMFFCVPSGLCLYFIASSLWGIAERKVLPKITPSAGGTGGGDGGSGGSTPSGDSPSGRRRPERKRPSTNGNGTSAANKKKRRQKGKK